MYLKQTCALLAAAMLCSCSHTPSADTSENIRENCEIGTGLSNQFVYSITEDTLGQIWIGTFRGLNKFDTRNFHQYFAGTDSTSLPDDQVRDIHVDRLGRLWVATVDGVARYTDRDNFHSVHISPQCSRYLREIVETPQGDLFFINYDGSLMRHHQDGDSIGLVLPTLDPQNIITTNVHPDSSGKLWITSLNWIKLFDPSTGTMSDSIALDATSLRSFTPNDGEIWLAGDRFLRIFDMQNRRFKPLPGALLNHPVLANAEIELIHRFSPTEILLLTASDGLFLYDTSTGKVLGQTSDGFPFEAPKSKIHTMFTDSRGNLWFGFEDQGYGVHYSYKDRFNHNNFLYTHLRGKSVVAVATDAQGRLWAITKRDGIFIYDPDANKVDNIPPDRFMVSAPQCDRSPVNIMPLPDGDVWLLTGDNQAVLCSFSNGTFSVKRRVAVWLPMQMNRDDSGTLWVTTATPYVYVMRPGEDEFTPVQVFEGITFSTDILPFDENHMIAVAFYQPLKLIDRRTLEVRAAEIDEEQLRQSIRRSVFIPSDMYMTPDSTFWIGTISNGLLRYSKDGSICAIDGLACKDISAIEGDDEGNLWVSTLYGLSRLNLDSLKITNFYEHDGIGGNQFYDRSSAVMSDGSIVFGGTHGLTFFHPGEVSQSPDVPLLFQNLKIHNTVVQPGVGMPIDRHLSYAPDVHLKHDQNSFSIAFTALDYGDSHRVDYQYKLEGVDPQWVDANDRREASYANITPGNYTFRVRIPQGDTGRFREISLRLHISQPWWASWWAILLYVIIGLLVIYLLVSARMRVLAQRAAIRRERQEKEQERKVNVMNMRFFANISHEFRTPLTMISGPAAQLSQSEAIKDSDRTMLDIIRTNSDRMLQLVNQMLDFNKLEDDALRLQVSTGDIAAVLRHVTESFRMSAMQKDITWHTYGFDVSCPMLIDEDKIVKIYTNLCSNAVKYTPRGGQIRTSFDEVTDAGGRRWAKITVENTGSAIPDDKLEKIFERFYQLERHDTPASGSGIGLYYARRVAELHHGLLRAEAVEGDTGARFVAMIPMDEDVYTAAEIAPDRQRQDTIYPLSNGNAGFDAEVRDGLPQVLVVDDDAEVARYMSALLSRDYAVTTRFDVPSALEWLETETPVLIISDVVMPGDSGLDLCRHVKEDIRLCHIPVILLTAKTGVQNQVEGLEAQADAYVTKPFDPAFLMSLMRSLLANRDKARRIMNTQTTVDDVEPDVLSPADNAFMTELYALMEQEIANAELDVANISRMMRMSRTKFYYKVKGLTGDTPAVFFKTYKLNRAAQLIIAGHHTVSEIADMTGFTSLSHFSRSFKKQFGVAPSEYNPPHS